MEDEYHFLNICPAYQEKHFLLPDYLEKEYRIKISRMSPNRIFMFPINSPIGNVRIQKLIAKHVFECFEKRKGEDGKVNTKGLLRGNSSQRLPMVSPETWCDFFS